MSHSKKDNRDLRQQAYDRLKSMESYGSNKYVDKKYDREHDTNVVSEKIYSYSSFKTYWKHIKYYIRWLNVHHPEVKKLKKAEKYVSEWLQTRVDENKSAWTVQTEAAALNKLFGIKMDNPNRFQPPKRRKEDIVRSRGVKKRDAHFSKKNHEELVSFCKGCGFRRSVLERLRGKDLYDRTKIEEELTKARSEDNRAMIKACSDALSVFPDKEYFIMYRSDKGGKTRLSPIVGPNIEMIVERMKTTAPYKKVFEYVPGVCDVHGYRADYAAYLYKEYARPIDSLRYNRKILCADGKYRSEVYVCRGGESGKRLDRRAIGIISIALGHNREDTAITNYLRDIE